MSTLVPTLRQVVRELKLELAELEAEAVRDEPRLAAWRAELVRMRHTIDAALEQPEIAVLAATRVDDALGQVVARLEKRRRRHADRERLTDWGGQPR